MALSQQTIFTYWASTTGGMVLSVSADMSKGAVGALVNPLLLCSVFQKAELPT